MKMTIHKEEFKKLILARNLLICVIIFLIIILFFFILNLINEEKINKGMKIANISIGGLTKIQAEEKLNSTLEEFFKQDFFLKYENLYWESSLKNLGIEINISDTTNEAIKKGHQKNQIFKNAWWQLVSLFGYNAKPKIETNEEKLENFLKQNLSIHQPAINATLFYDENKKEFIPIDSKEGKVVNKTKLKESLIENIINLDIKDIELYLSKDYPEVLINETKQAQKQAREIIENTPIKLFAIENNNQEELALMDKEIILNILKFKPSVERNNSNNKILGIGLSEEKTKDYLSTLAPLINREPINAQLTIENDKVIVFVLSKDGLELEIEKNILNLLRAITNKQKEVELEVKKTKPQITTESIDNLGITSLLANGESNFSGSPSSRIHNIKIGIAKFNGVLIRPNEEFSFNKILGEVGPEQGYKPELVIKRDKTIPEYGGGLCQASTTMFRAAINTGLKITQRYPHAFPVKYYNPQGFDATIYPPFPDLKFINNTPNHILIQTKINEKEYILNFEIYGTNDNRKVEIDGPYQYDIKDDGSMKTRLIQKVYDEDNNIIIDKTFYSFYKSPDLYPVEKNPLE